MLQPSPDRSHYKGLWDTKECYILVANDANLPYAVHFAGVIRV
jgi:hypothetical protein